jgi:hypothetical protein
MLHTELYSSHNPPPPPPPISCVEAIALMWWYLEGFRLRWCHEGGALIMGLVLLHKKKPENVLNLSPQPPPPCEDIARRWLLQTNNGTFTRTQPCWDPYLRLSTYSTVTQSMVLWWQSKKYNIESHACQSSTWSIVLGHLKWLCLQHVVSPFYFLYILWQRLLP